MIKQFKFNYLIVNILVLSKKDVIINNIFLYFFFYSQLISNDYDIHNYNRIRSDLKIYSL